MTDTFREVQRRIALSQHGHGWIGLCPFHDETSPSFNVRPAHSTYHCFGCGEHGTLADLLAKLDAMPHRCNAMVFWSGKPVVTDDEKAAEMLAAIVHAHHQIYGTWPEPPQVRAALVGLNIPVKDQR